MRTKDKAMWMEMAIEMAHRNCAELVEVNFLPIWPWGTSVRMKFRLPQKVKA